MDYSPIPLGFHGFIFNHHISLRRYLSKVWWGTQMHKGCLDGFLGIHFNHNINIGMYIFK